MTLLRQRMGRTSMFLLVSVISFLIGLGVSAYLYHKYVFSWTATNHAADIAWQLRTVSHLRLGETNEAIGLIEEQIDFHVVALGQVRNVAKSDYPCHVLREARTYRDLYPPDSPHSSKALRVLEEYPTLETFECANALARLVQRTRSQESR